MNGKSTILKPNWLRLIAWALLAVLIAAFSLFPGAVEKYYATGVYPGISLIQRILTRYIPFSLGDILYILFVLWLIGKLVLSFRLARRNGFSKEFWLSVLYRTARFCIGFYIVFKLLWGLNYNRLGIEHQLSIAKKTYTKEEVVELTKLLIDKVNECRRQIPDTTLPVPPLDSLYREAYRSYQAISLNFEFLNYRNRSVKGSLFSKMGDYMGFSGYYNPFTGEAQLRTDIPRVLIPYIACHEMAHQLGYASESEANFVGYLAASASTDPYFRYSVYLDMFSYAQGEEIYMYGAEKDSTGFTAVIKYNREHLDSLVKKDRREIREFFAKRKNRVSPAVSSLYDQYLKMNQQSKGIKSYDEVLGWLLGYYRKYGKL